MQISSHLLTKRNRPVELYSSEQLYAMEQAWFAGGHDSFSLMQQAAWQMAHHIEQIYEQRHANASANNNAYHCNNSQRRASVWVGKGNNGGDGWLIAYYLQQMGWQVKVTTVGFEHHDFESGDVDTGDSRSDAHIDKAVTDAKKALQIALSADCEYQRFEDINYENYKRVDSHWQADVYIDALFGIGLDRAPAGVYQQAIFAFNDSADYNKSYHKNTLVFAVDISSGLVASTGEVFDGVAVQADVTLCLIARKFGLHTKDGLDYSGEIMDIPLIPYPLDNKKFAPIAKFINAAHLLSPRRQNSYKGSYGHVLVIGGNRIDGSQGMGGAAILSASSAMATGAGKITVACHEAFHGALLTSLPDAMSINLHDTDGVKNLIKKASVLAIGMGLGRDEKAEALFLSYIQTAIAEKKPIIIDADGLYHLASLQRDSHELVAQLKTHSMQHQVCLTPHSGEAARLLNTEVGEIEADRLAAIQQCAETYGGSWVLKGAGSLVLEQVLEQVSEQNSVQSKIYVCGVGNAGMATAGMGDVLSGVVAGLLAQQDLEEQPRSLHQAVVIHGLAGDVLVDTDHNNPNMLCIGQRGLQAQDMPAAIRHVIQSVTKSGR